MSSDSESYVKDLMSRFQPKRSAGIKLYQLKSLKFKAFKPLLYRIKLLHQIGYRLQGTRFPTYVVLNIFLKQQQQRYPDSLKASSFNYKFAQFNDVSEVG